MSAITTSDLLKRYGDTLALDGLELNVREGEVYGSLGAGGAGKTTTMRVLRGVQRPTTGSAQMFGIDARRDPLGT